jgi:hypothetical protein
MATKTNIKTEQKKVYVSNRPNISMKELKKMFPYMTEEELESDMQNNEWIKLEKFLEQERKTNEGYRIHAERPDVKRLRIHVQWKKSATWGRNPHVHFSCHFQDGTYTSGDDTCGGCGYDKESTVIARIFNQCCSGMLWRKRNSKKNTPYGIHRGKGWYFPNFAGGVGVSCYPSITEFLGGKWECVDSGKDYDSYEITFPMKK